MRVSDCSPPMSSGGLQIIENDRWSNLGKHTVLDHEGSFLFS